MSSKQLKKNKELDNLVKQINSEVKLRKNISEILTQKFDNSRLRNLKLPNRSYVILLKNGKQRVILYFKDCEFDNICLQELKKPNWITSRVLILKGGLYLLKDDKAINDFIKLLLKNEEYILRELLNQLKDNP